MSVLSVTSDDYNVSSRITDEQVVYGKSFSLQQNPVGSSSLADSENQHSGSSNNISNNKNSSTSATVIRTSKSSDMDCDKLEELVTPVRTRHTRTRIRSADPLPQEVDWFGNIGTL